MIMPKKHKELLFVCSNLHLLGPTSRTSFHTQHSRCRSFTINLGGQKQEPEKLRWPDVISPNVVPTPYEIFNLKKNSPYSKIRFYELVKLYHPDRYELDASVDALSKETKLERYRLVIAANSILGDPARRSAYDRNGAGWNGQSHISSYQNYSHDNNLTGKKKWNRGPDGPSQNATWEDWERWYARDGPQEPIYVSNAAFVGLILTFALLGGIGQAARAGNNSLNFIEQRNVLHNKVSSELAHIKKESTESSIQEERIHRFMRNRDPVGNSIEDLSEENLKKLFESTNRRPCKNIPSIQNEDNY